MLAKYYLLKKRKLSSQITLISSARKEHSNVDSMIFINKIINYVSHALNIILQSSSDKYIDDDLHLTIKLIEEYVVLFVNKLGISIEHSTDIR